MLMRTQTLGSCMRGAKACPIQSHEKAAKLVRKAAEQLHPRANYNAGAIYTNGQSAPQSFEETSSWPWPRSSQANPTRTEAAEKGRCERYFNFGLSHFQPTAKITAPTRPTTGAAGVAAAKKLPTAKRVPSGTLEIGAQGGVHVGWWKALCPHSLCV
jgi:hypothetical protein